MQTTSESFAETVITAVSDAVKTRVERINRKEEERRQRDKLIRDVAKKNEDLITKLSAEVTASRQERAELRATITGLERNANSREIQNASLEERINVLQAAARDNASALRRAESDLTAERTTVTKLTGVVESSKEDISYAKSMRMKLAHGYVLTDTLGLEKLKSQAEELVGLKNALSELQSKNDTLNSELKTARKTIDDLKSANVRLTNDLEFERNKSTTMENLVKEVFGADTKLTTTTKGVTKITLGSKQLETQRGNSIVDLFSLVTCSQVKIDSYKGQKMRPRRHV